MECLATASRAVTARLGTFGPATKFVLDMDAESDTTDHQELLIELSHLRAQKTVALNNCQLLTLLLIISEVTSIFQLTGFGKSMQTT